MAKKVMYATGVMVLSSLITVAVLIGCASDREIGKQGDVPIRQKKIISAGEPMGYAGGKPFMFTKVDMYARYVDINNNGSFDEGIDEVVYRVPRSDPAIYYDYFETDAKGRNFPEFPR